MRKALFVLPFLLPIPALAQPTNTDCATAQLLCAQQPALGNNTGATGTLPAFCPPADNLLWFTFFTNTQGGPVNVRVNAIDCPVIAGMDDELSVVVLSGDGLCTPAAFAAVSPCELNNQSFVTTTLALAPNTQYWVVVAGVMDGSSTIAAQCDFRITLTGPGVDVVDVDFDAGTDVEIPEGGSTQLNATGGTTYLWTPTVGLSGNTIPDPIANPTSSTAYAVTTVINGCTFTDTVVVDVIRLIDPPNTFTPNGDGINDTWEVPGIADYPGSEVLIFDRWGQKIFKSNGYREPWDGTNKGKELSEGSYYYYIQLNELEGKSAPYTGFISIIR